MASETVRNPLAGFMLAILSALGLSAVAGYASTYVPYMEFRLFFLGFAFFGIGAFAGRKTYLGSLGFVGAYLGTFLGFYLVEQFFAADFWIGPQALALVLAFAAGLGGFVTGKIGVHRLERQQRFTSGLRRCSSCGARVGVSARKCWSCKATLTY